MNMFKPVGAKNSEDYVAMLNDDRREMIEFLDEFIRKSVPSLKPHFAYNMLGYGKFKYKNYKKVEAEWPVVALASQKNYISVYVCGIDSGEYVAEKYEKELGKVNVGKSCIRFKNLSDIDLKTLKKVLQIAEKNPGLVSTGYKKKK